MSKRNKYEVAFGSDAFLDVIANLVGIVIILIVVAGVRVSQSPIPANLTKTLHAEPLPAPSPPLSATLPALDAEEMQAPAMPDANLISQEPQLTAPPQEIPVASSETWTAAEPVVEIPPAPPAIQEPLPEFPELPPPAPPTELVQEAAELELELSQLRQQLTDTGETARQEQAAQSVAGNELNQLKAKALETVAVVQRLQSKLEAVESDAAERRRLLKALEEVIDKKQRQEPPVAALEHRLNPIGQTVQGNEIHFRLEGNKVSHVPVMELAKLVKSDMERRKEILLNRSFYKGTIGPREGYRMEYLVQRESNSMADDLRYGVGMIRVLVTQWVILPEKGLEAESAEEALRPESKFIEAIRQAKGATTITFWVYPDSFELHRKLKEVIHDTGFAVASRPLPTGVPIAGSPDGSKSVSQ